MDKWTQLKGQWSPTVIRELFAMTGDRKGFTALTGGRHTLSTACEVLLLTAVWFMLTASLVVPAAAVVVVVVVAVVVVAVVVVGPFFSIASWYATSNACPNVSTISTDIC